MSDDLITNDNSSATMKKHISRALIVFVWLSPMFFAIALVLQFRFAFLYGVVDGPGSCFGSLRNPMTYICYGIVFVGTCISIMLLVFGSGKTKAIITIPLVLNMAATFFVLKYMIGIF
ncbi:MAG: hypothetical protein FWC50_11760 [Planctomycetaceae bacterium]|nr:hypothetical protein [Planctomycetaceae bacterium]